MKTERILVTGSAGFMGSHLCGRLVKEGWDVTAVDNLSTGRRDFIKHLEGLDNFRFVREDLLHSKSIDRLMADVECVFHLAANPDVRIGVENTCTHLEQNILVTHNLLESMRRTGVAKIIFTSTSTIYGEAGVIPTSENYGPLKPISLYGASKLACEAMISSYCHIFGMKSVLLRPANIVGARSTHGVIYDFIKKLRSDNSRLEILGDGKQTKSYCYISDCIDAMMIAFERSKERVGIFNIGSEDYTRVTRVADIVVEEIGLKDVKYTYVKNVEGGRGWRGDVKTMLLSVKKLKQMGWRPRYSSENALRTTVRDLLKE